MATLEQFAANMKYLEAGVGLSDDRRPTKEQTAVYFDLLGDLPADVLHTAVRRVLLDHTFATLPSPAAIRRAALDLTDAVSLTTGEAWQQAVAAVRRHGQNAREGLASLPPAVADAVRAYGWSGIAESRPGDTTAFAQFRDVYAGLEARRRSEAALPAGLRSAALAGPQTAALPPAVAGVVGSIGRRETA